MSSASWSGEGAISMSRIADLLDVSMPNASGLVDRMVERGLRGARRRSGRPARRPGAPPARWSAALEAAEGIKLDGIRTVCGHLDDGQLERISSAIGDLRGAIAQEFPTQKQGKDLMDAIPNEFEASAAPTASEDPAMGLDHRAKMEILFAILLGLFLAALDQTIVGPVLPTIVTAAEWRGLYTWVVTIFLLTSTVTVPIYGKLSDLYGRRPLLLFGISLFLVGSFLSGLSQTMWQLILFRGIQGLGAGALFPIALAIIGDLFSPAERGKYQGLFGAVFGIAFLVGPGAGRLPHRPSQLALDLLRQHPDRPRRAVRHRPAAARTSRGATANPSIDYAGCRHADCLPRADPRRADRRGDIHLDRPVGLGHGPRSA